MFHKFERFSFVTLMLLQILQQQKKGRPCHVRLIELSCHSEGTLPGKSFPGVFQITTKFCLCCNKEMFYFFFCLNLFGNLYPRKLLSPETPIGFHKRQFKKKSLN